MQLILGLGNPGKKYAQTRHNAGYLALDNLADQLGLRWKSDTKRQALLAHGVIDDTPFILAKPTTSMNLSGYAAQALLKYYKINLVDLLVVQDDMDLEPGRLSFRARGGTAGHNGIASIVEQLGTNAFARLRLGIGRPVDDETTENWVLSRLTRETEKAISRAPQALTDWITQGLTQAMNRWN